MSHRDAGPKLGADQSEAFKSRKTVPMTTQFSMPLSRLREPASILAVYVSLVIAAGTLMLGFLLFHAAAAFHGTDLTFWLLAVCVLPAEVIRYRTTHRGDVHHVTTLSRPFALAMLTGWPIPATVLVFVLASIVSDVIYRKPAVRIPFNAAQYVLSLSAAGAVYELLGGRPQLGLRQVPAFFAAAAVLVLINHLLVRIVGALSQQELITIRFILGFTRLDFLEGAVQCGVVLIALLVANQRPVLPLLLALPALPLFVAGQATARVDMLSRGRYQTHKLAEVQAMLRATELERVRLAADLHDGPLRTIDQLEQRIQDVQADIEAGSFDVRLVEQLRQEIPALSRNLRTLVTELRPPVLQRLGLAGALTRLAKEFETAYGIAFEVQASPVDRLSEELEVVLYRVTQEALTNVVKHARASRVKVTVGMSDRAVRLQIHDDGIGFDPALVEGGHYGLAIMRERVELAGGAFQLESTLGGGSTITVDLEVDAEA
jgi:signal transduction histidine kinase